MSLDQPQKTISKSETERILQAVRNPGAALFMVRRSRKIPLKRLAKQLKFSGKQLDALERWDTDQLLDPAYLQGMITRYSNFVGFDHRPLLAMPAFKDFAKGRHKSTAKLSSKDLKIKPESIQTLFVGKKLKKLAIVLPILVVMSYLVWLIFPASRAPVISIESHSTGQSVDINPVIVSGSSKRASSIVVNGTKAVIDESDNFEARVILTPGENDIELRATNSLGDETITEITLFLNQ